MKLRDSIRFAGLALTVVFAASASACSSGSSDGDGTAGDAPVFNAADPTKVCPAGYVGWDFATGGASDVLPPTMSVESVSCANSTYAAEPDTVKKACNAATACEPSMVGCYFGDMTVKYRCGGADGDLMTRTQRIGGESSTLNLSCPTAGDGDAGAKKEATPTGKACVPKVCPATTYRNAKMECAPVQKQVANVRLSPPFLYATRATVADPLNQRVVGGTEYQFEQGITVISGVLPQARIAIYLTDVFEAPGKTPIEGFRCTATNLASDPVHSDQVSPNQYVVRHRGILSPECTSDTSDLGALEDAARRAGELNTEFGDVYKRTGLRVHAVWDPEGRTVQDPGMDKFLPQALQCNTPNPVGFFYKPNKEAPQKSTMDMLGYYRQREATVYGTGYLPTRSLANSDAEKLVGNAGQPFGTAAVAKPTRIAFEPGFVRVETPELLVKKFGNSMPTLDVSVGYSMSGGDEARNPYSYEFAGPSNGTKTLRDLNFRADFYLVPFNDDPGSLAVAPPRGLARQVGSVLLGEAIPTGSTFSATVSVPRSKIKAFFDKTEWLQAKYVGVFYCLAADGYDASGRVKDFPTVTNGGVRYGAGLKDGATDDSGCVMADTAIAVVRDETRSPFDPTAKNSSLENGAESTTGNRRTSGAQANDAEQNCTSLGGDRCTVSRHASMGASGMFGQTLFDSSSDTAKDSAEDGSGEAGAEGTGEALGYNVIDADDADENLKWADETSTPKTGLSFEITPNWDMIVKVLKNGFKVSNIEFEKGRFGGRDGLGVSAGFRTYMQVGPIPGMVQIGVSAGVSIGIAFNVSFKPDKEYPCMNPAEDARCYQTISEKKTLAVQRGECAKLGGRLAEVRTEQDWTAIKTILGKAPEVDKYWVGGQATYRYPGAECTTLGDSNKKACVESAKLSYRWFSDDKEFASATGIGLPTLATDAVLEDSDLSLVSTLPTDGTVAFDTLSQRLVLRDAEELRPALCQFEPAKAERYTSYSGGLNLGAGAGLALTICSPHDSFGVCVEGRIGFVDVQLSFLGGRDARKLTLTDGSKISVGGTFIDVPWSLNLLKGSVTATLNFFLFNFSYTVVEWPGFKVAGGSLFNYYTPVVEKL
ncbi:MAG: C-type lectin domain-containing protein [Polyangiaceae bacterium]